MSKAKSIFKGMWKPRVSNPDLTAALGRWLIAERHFTDPQLEYALTRIKTAWCRAQLFLELSPTLWPLAQLSRLANAGVRDTSDDVAICAAQLAGRHSIAISRPFNRINRAARRILQEFGLVRRMAGQTCGISISLERILRVSTKVNWRKLFGAHYRDAERQIVESRGYIETNPSAWVNSLDVFNDYLVWAVFQRDGTIGKYTLGRIGSVLTPTSRLAKNYPELFYYVREVHNLRYKSSLSHPLILSSGKATGRIPYSSVRRSRSWMRKAIRELSIHFSV
jgi:hypothetical protein